MLHRVSQPVRVSIGRQRISAVRRAASPAESRYAFMIRDQMNTIRENLKSVIREIEGATPEALVFGLQPIFDESQRLVPELTGALKASGFLEVQPSTTGGAAAIGYAKGGTPRYAAIVHERVWVSHAAPTQAKFLEEAVNQHFNEIAPRVISFIRTRTGLTD